MHQHSVLCMRALLFIRLFGILRANVASNACWFKSHRTRLHLHEWISLSLRSLYAEERRRQPTNHAQRSTTNSSARQGDPALWLGFARAPARTGRGRAPGDNRATQPAARRFHDIARSLQEVTLAGCRADVLSTASAVRQTFRRTGRNR